LSVEKRKMTINIYNYCRCNASPVLKIREMAAKALQPLVDKDHVTTVFIDLLTLLPGKSTDVLKQNQIHGTLLHVRIELFEFMQNIQLIYTNIDF